MTGAPWYDALDPVSVEIDCSGSRHRITWRRGKLIVEDHDVEAEAVLAALGGSACMCTTVLEGWRRNTRNLELLPGLIWQDESVSPQQLAEMAALHEQGMEHFKQMSRRLRQHWAAMQAAGSAPPVGQMITGRAPQQMAYGAGGVTSGGPGPWALSAGMRGSIVASGWVGGPTATGPPLQELQKHFARMQEENRAAYERAVLTSLPSELRGRLGLSMIAWCARNWRDQAFRLRHEWALGTTITRLAQPAVEASIERWRRHRESGGPFVFECWIQAPGSGAELSGWVDSAGGYGAATLPISWALDVWGRGISLVDGCFVVELNGIDAGSATLHVQATRWERASRGISTAVVAPAVLTPGREVAWRLRWV